MPPNRRHRAGRNPGRATGVPAVSAAAGATVAAALLPGSALTAVAVLVATLGAGSAGIRLIRLSLRIHARAHSFGPCRGAGYLGLGTAVAATTAAVGGVVTMTGGASVAAAAVQLGTVAASAAYPAGLLLLPGAAPTTGGRLRHALDGVGVGSAVFLVIWLLVIAPDGRVPHDARALVGLVVSVALATTTVTGLRAAAHRPAARACAAGVALALAGLAVPALGRTTPHWLLIAAIALVVGPALMLTGAARADSAPVGPATPPDRGGLAARPLLAIPVGAVVAAAAYHAVTAGRFDGVAGALGLLLVTTVGLRESLGAMDVRRYAARLAEQQARFQALVAGSADVTMVLDTDLVVLWQSPAAARLFGLADQDVLDRPFTARLHEADAGAVVDRLIAVLAGGAPDGPPVRARLRDGFGAWRDTESTVRDMRVAPEVGALVVHVRDVGDVTGLRRRLAHATHTDPLTGLPNERRLLEVAAGRLADGVRGSMVVVGVSGIAGVNELYGTAAGDAVLIAAAERIRAEAGPDDTVARLSGHRFAVLTGCSALRAYPRAARLVERCAEQYDLSIGSARVTVVAGIAEVDAAAVDALRHAVAAADRAQLHGPGRVEGYDDGLAAAVRRRAAIEQRLAAAIDAGGFDLVYQPVLDLRRQLPVAVEALLRWRLPGTGVVPAPEVVAAAEELGCVDRLDTRVIRRACRQLARWRRDGHDLTMAVNVSPRQLAGDLLPAVVDDALARNDLPADRLIVEVAARDVPAGATPEALTRLRRRGVRVALDHFGTGSLSLARLPALPVDVVKVDRSLFGTGTDLVDVVLTLGERLGFDVTAVGIESDAELAALRAAGCTTGQGNLMAPPAHAERVEAYLEEHRARLL